MTRLYDQARALRRSLRHELPAVPVRARHAEWSAVSSADDLYVRPTDALVALLLEAAENARDVRLDEIASRCATEDEAGWVNLWPGEHYRLLVGLVVAARARFAVEVGTFRGHGALALKEAIPADGAVVTYDVIAWSDIDEAVVRAEDFDHQLEQRIGDLSSPEFLEQQLETLKAADLIFVDGPKDGVFEPTFCHEVLPRLTDRSRLVVFDDIKRMNMLQLWRDLPFAKLDATSLGHWSGTGLLLTR